jgi:hypothetical protein
LRERTERLEQCQDNYQNYLNQCLPKVRLLKIVGDQTGKNYVHMIQNAEKGKMVQNHLALRNFKKMINNDVAKMVGDYLNLETSSKMRMTDKNWSKLEIYEDVFPNESTVKIFRHTVTNEYIFSDPQELIPSKKRSWYTDEIVPNKELLLASLQRVEEPNWNDVLEWLSLFLARAEEDRDSNLRFQQTISFIRELMSVVAQKVNVERRPEHIKITSRSRCG